VVAHNEKGVPDFKALRRREPPSLYAFDLLQINGIELRQKPIEFRREALRDLITGHGPAILYSEEIDAPAELAFKHVCKLGLEGIVSKKAGHGLRVRPVPAMAQDSQSQRSRQAASARGGLERWRTKENLKLINDAPSMVVVLDAVTQAQAVLASYLDPSRGPSDAEATLRKLLAILDDQEVVRAVDRLRP